MEVPHERQNTSQIPALGVCAGLAAAGAGLVAGAERGSARRAAAERLHARDGRVDVRAAGGAAAGEDPAAHDRLERYLAAWLVPIALVALGAALFYAIFPAAFDASASSYFSTLPEEALQAYEAQGLSRGLLIIVSILGAVSYAPFINILFSLGEEAGWRGYLYPRLKERFGKTRGRLLAGVIWGVWHWPVIILAGYEYGLDYWGAPVAGPLLFCVFTVAIGTLLDWLYEKTGSIWAASLGHGAINAVANLPVMFLVASYADRSILGPFANGLIGGLPLILLAAAVLVKKEKA